MLCFVLSCLSHSTKQGSQSLLKCLISIKYLLLIDSDYYNLQKKTCISNILISIHWNSCQILFAPPDPTFPSALSSVYFIKWCPCPLTVSWALIAGPKGKRKVGIYMPFIPFLPGSFWLATSFHQTGLLHARPSVF